MSSHEVYTQGIKFSTKLNIYMMFLAISLKTG
ncbi:hypothetical protein EV196_11060 [Mariniflexile fucanivorans]|uniref:Uncharacterized protein n=1 Tax=Mariniflexile fucanivorans TaxID=264023 RepID=A0A4V2QD55_9FLAO|nr:hypothetical protein EV196_11060 [Mariniflexile fucanivorans]